MNFKRSVIITSKVLLVSFLSAGMLFSSCKKDKDDEESLPSMEGNLDFELPMYSLVGETYTVKGNSIIDPASGITYFWYGSGIIKDTVYAQSATFTVPDSLATYNIQYTAKCDGYYNTSRTKSITAINPARNASLVGLEYSNDSIKDARDNKWYHIKKIGNLYWFTENLNYDGAGVYYANSSAAGVVYGKLYTWNEATGGVSAQGLGNGPQGLCPDGWSIPTAEDWQDLAKAAIGTTPDFLDIWNGVGDALAVPAKFNGNDVWPFSGVATPSNKLGWNALSGGYVINNGSNFYSISKYGFWWTAAQKDSDNAYYRYIFYDQTGCPANSTSKTNFGASVRCVKKVE